ncbi:VOC family protein [Burkholderia latens]|uniref:Glyoxalase n=1 Tax=Burkholderia latens TaxID=488446 RepID=A0A6H9TS53_9BURK|nr:VOC family protein [Burkholderia latens]KAB0643197.1 glyoxalase [Burkholderia latens]VWB85735.1 glyoxalase [Burkholderia latens]
MSRILAIDHVAITVADLAASCAFYDDLFGTEVVAEHVIDGQVLVRQLAIGGAVLSVHQKGNGIELVAGLPTVGAADICLRWNGSVSDMLGVLKEKSVDILEGPVARMTADKRPSQSVFFRDIDGNLLELMAADDARASER